MPRKKSRSFYIDTNIALDYATKRDIQTVLVLEKIKEKGWRCVSCTFLAMEMADYKKDALFIAQAMSKKWEVRKILRKVNNKDLRKTHFDAVYDWFEDFKKQYQKIQMYDFLQDEDAWELAQEISFSSNLAAPDVIHLTSALVGAATGVCDILVTRDKLLADEAKRIITEHKMKGKLKVMSIAEVKTTFFPKPR